jgi:hypothetical protein
MGFPSQELMEARTQRKPGFENAWYVMCSDASRKGGTKMVNQWVLGDLICSLYDACSEQYGDNELAALAADVMLNDLLVRFDVHELHEQDVREKSDEDKVNMN